MRTMITFIAGLYITVTLVVFGGSAYSFLSGEHAKYSTCPPNWTWALYRAAAWPKAYYDDRTKVAEIPDWLLVRYRPFGDACGAR
jgi:hypothetical protein